MWPDGEGVPQALAGRGEPKSSCQRMCECAHLRLRQTK